MLKSEQQQSGFPLVERSNITAAARAAGVARERLDGGFEDSSRSLRIKSNTEKPQMQRHAERLEMFENVEKEEMFCKASWF